MMRLISGLLCFRPSHKSRAATLLAKNIIRTALPYELIDIIVRDVWCSSTPDTRWDLFCAISLISRLWRIVSLDVAIRHVYFESHRDFTAYRSIVSPYLNTRGYQVGDAGHSAISRNCLISIRLNSFYATHITQISELIPDARYLELSIPIDRRRLFDDTVPHVLVNLPSLTHLRLCWPPLGFSFSCAEPSVHIPSVTHLHIQRHPHGSLYSVLALFPNVTHLRLSTPCFLKDLVPRMTSVQVLMLDAPPNYAIADKRFATSIMLWNVAAALEHGMLLRGDTPKKLIMNVGIDDPMELLDFIEESCQNHNVYGQCRRIYTLDTRPPAFLENGHWDYGIWD